MVGVPRSQRLLAFVSTAQGPSPVWTSPPNFITLLKSADFYQEAATTIYCRLIVRAVEVNVQHVVVAQTLELGTPYHWDGWIVLNPGDSLWTFADAAGVESWVSGAILAGPPQFPPASREVVNQLPSDRPFPAPI